MPLDVDGRALHPLADVLAAAEFPLTGLLPAGAFDRIFYLSSDAAFDEDVLVLALELAFEGELALTPPGDSVFSFALGSATAGWTGIRAMLTLGAEPSILLEEVTVAVRLRADVLRDVTTGGPAAIIVAADLRVTPDGLTLERFAGAGLAPAYVADTEIVVRADRVRPVFGMIDPPGWLEDREDFRGLAIDELSVTLPGKYLTTEPGADLQLKLAQAAIDGDGFSGAVSALADPEHPVRGTLFGFPFRFRALELDIQRNAVRAGRLAVDLRLTPLETGGREKWIALDVGFAAGRQVSAGLSASQPPGASDDPRFLVSFEAAEVVRLGITALQLDAGGFVLVLVFSGAATLLIGAGKVNWPTVAFDGLGVGSDGSVRLPSGGVVFAGSATAALGPVTLRASGFGAGAGAGGSLVLTPPRELGVELSAPPVSGAGIVGHDPAIGRYAGALAVQLQRVAVRALGILDTRLPGGQRGFSLLVMLSASFSPGIQLGFGIMLTGVGGLVGVNRRIEVDALRERFAAGTAARILNPPDPGRALVTQLTELAAVFPPAEGVVVVGPTVQLQEHFDERTDDDATLRDILRSLRDVEEEPPLSRPVDVDGIAADLAAAFDPARPDAPVRKRVLDRITGLDPAEPFAPPEPCIGLDLPVWRELARLAPDWLLPGVGQLDPDVVIALKTNPVFIDAFLTGLNTRTLEELRWRNIRVAGGCTPLRTFWTRVAAAGDGRRVDDIIGIQGWERASTLGDPQHSPDDADGADPPARRTHLVAHPPRFTAL